MRLCPAHQADLDVSECTSGFEECEVRLGRAMRIMESASSFAAAMELIKAKDLVDEPIIEELAKRVTRFTHTLPMQLEALKQLEALDHSFLTEFGALQIALPFGMGPRLKTERVDHVTPTGLRVPGKQHGEAVYGIAAHELAEQLLERYGLARKVMLEGRGSRLRAAIATLRAYLGQHSTAAIGVGKARWPTPPDRWHYTVGVKWELIEKSGVIKQATSGIPKGERPAVWFSTRQDWEPTATKGALPKAVFDQVDPKTGEAIIDMKKLARHELTQYSFEEMRRELKGMYRIGVTGTAAPHSWSDFVQLSGVDRVIAAALVSTAKERGADPEDWWCSFDPVPKSEWRSVEILFQGKWEPVEW